MNLIRGVDEFISGRTDAGYFAVGQAKVAEADAAVGGIRFLPPVETPEAIAAMQEDRAYAVPRTLSEPPLYRPPLPPSPTVMM